MPAPTLPARVRIHGFLPLMVDGEAIYPVQVCRCCGKVAAPDAPACVQCLVEGEGCVVLAADHVFAPHGDGSCQLCFFREEEHQCPGDLAFGSLSGPALGCALSGVN